MTPSATRGLGATLGGKNRHMSWEHDAHKYSRQLLHAASMRYSGDLPVLSGEDTAKCTVLEAAGDGNCSLHSIYRLLHPERDSVMKGQQLLSLRNYGQLLDNTVSEEEMLRLSNLGFDKGFYRKRTSSSGRGTRRKPVKIVREVVEDMHNQLGRDHGLFHWHLFGKNFLHLVYNDCGGYGADSCSGGAVTVRNPSSSNVAETKLNHFSAIVIPQELVPCALPYMLARGSSRESVFGHRKAADDFRPCPTTSDKRSTKHGGSTIAFDTDDDDETETNSSVRSPRSAGGARSVTTLPTCVSKPEAPPGKAAIKPATPPSASSMSATTGANETPTPAETPTKLASSKAQELSSDASESETLEARAAGADPSKKKHGKRKRRETCHALFASGKGKGSAVGPRRSLPVVCSVACTEPEGDEEMSDGGSDGEFPGDLADYDEPSVTIKSSQQINAMVDKKPEGWGRAALKFVFELVQHTHDFRNDLKVGMCALIFLGVFFFGKSSPLSGVLCMCCHLGPQRQHESYRGKMQIVRLDRPAAAAAVRMLVVELAVETATAVGAVPCGIGVRERVQQMTTGVIPERGAVLRAHVEVMGLILTVKASTEETGTGTTIATSKKTLDALPMFGPEKLGRFSADGLGELAFTFLCIMFPAAVISHLVLKTNEYFKFCTSTTNPKGQEQRHRDKKKKKGVIGITLDTGQVQLPELQDH
ncbi:unnamed protein product [Ectocarpus sp. CCAP 1310/34]|nr:unnamed protein product [Ectocarpus sp. CCAP 1310/34]